MLRRTHAHHAPWVVIKADDKKTARINLLRDLVRRMDHDDLGREILEPDRGIVFEYADGCRERLAR